MILDNPEIDLNIFKNKKCFETINNVTINDGTMPMDLEDIMLQEEGEKKEKEIEIEEEKKKNKGKEREEEEQNIKKEKEKNKKQKNGKRKGKEKEKDDYDKIYEDINHSFLSKK
ncbi:hypothetical protein BCR36DRAFT_375998 [Piromyces finnis]|uniref:Uncharacterized protein n=1 Tax=Piromyces finnis TaxID=1754191 RepID=A0A1Y1U5D8_9FUNG|nr:hypothetical protein BCR36DRAFT_375998 [Piromyces finnis]|eukprot:ORX33238.1 hypothetical protein BCR36DRAFT_375998 [Piromyces finnis]